MSQLLDLEAQSARSLYVAITPEGLKLHFSQLRPLVINLRSNIPSPKPIYILKEYSPVVAPLVSICSVALKPRK
jgi:hypothetical protein